MTRLSRRLASTIIGILFLLVGALVYEFSFRSTSTNLEQVDFRLKWLFLANYAESFVAKERSFWANEGLEVRLHPGGFENDSIKLVASGSDEFGITGADDLIIARSKGVPIVAIAAIYQDTPVAFMVHTDSGIRTPSDFAGCRVGVKHGTNVDVQYRILVRSVGIDPDSMTEVAVRFDLSPFVNGAVDVYPGFAMGQPDELRNKGIDIRVIRAKDHGISSYGNVLFTTERMIIERPSTVQTLPVPDSQSN